MTHAELTKKYCPLTGNTCLGKDCAKCEKMINENNCFKPMYPKADKSLTLEQRCARLRICIHSPSGCDNCEHQQLKCGL